MRFRPGNTSAVGAELVSKGLAPSDWPPGLVLGAGRGELAARCFARRAQAKVALGECRQVFVTEPRHCHLLVQRLLKEGNSIAEVPDFRCGNQRSVACHLVILEREIGKLFLRMLSGAKI